MDISHHAVKDGSISPIKDIVFVMDALKEEEENPKKRKSKKKDDSVECTARNFGAYLNISKFKECPHFKIAFRCRIESGSEGRKTLMPMRPVACLAGMLELDAVSIRLM